MEFNVTPLRILICVTLLVGFWLLGGFTMPEIPDQIFGDPAHLVEAWLKCMTLFCAGAVSATMLDHYVGTIDRTNLRYLYVLLGVAMMTVSFFWMRSLQDQFALVTP